MVPRPHALRAVAFAALLLTPLGCSQLAGTGDRVSVPEDQTPTTTTAPQPQLGAPTTTAPAAPAVTLAADRMVFDSFDDGNGEIYSLRTDGDASTLTQLTDDGAYDSFWPRVSPDRSRILFHRNPVGGIGNEYDRVSLWVMDADGTDVHMLRGPADQIGWGLAGHAEWSPDGQTLAMTGAETPTSHVNLWLLDAATGDVIRRLTNFGGASGGRALDPSWSPDGTRVIFVGCLSGWCPWNEQDVYSVDVASGQITRHTNNTIAEWDPFFSPDGTMVSWNQQPAFFVPFPDGIWDILVADWNPTGELTNQRILVGDGVINGTTEWSADGESIYFHRHTLPTGYRLHEVDIDTGALTMLPLPVGFAAFDPDRGAAGH